MKLVKLNQAEVFANGDNVKLWNIMPCTPAWYPEQHKFINE